MNKETRIFILGLILHISGAIAVSVSLIEMINETFEYNIWRIFFFIGTIYAMIVGAIKIYMTTD